MSRTVIVSILAAILLLPGPAKAQSEGGDGPSGAVDSLALARQYTQWLYAGEGDSLVAHSTEEARESFATRDRFAQYGSMIGQRAGFETDDVEESWKLRNGECQYWRVARFTDVDEMMLVRWVLDERGRITGLGLGPISQAPPVEAETCAPPASD